MNGMCGLSGLSGIFNCKKNSGPPQNFIANPIGGGVMELSWTAIGNNVSLDYSLDGETDWINIYRR